MIHWDSFVGICSWSYLRTVKSEEGFNGIIALVTAISPHHNCVVAACIELRVSQDRMSPDEDKQLGSGVKSRFVPSRRLAESWRLGPDSQ